MRVLQINLVCGHGSTGKIAVNIANMLKANGDEAYVAYGSGTTDYPESFRITSDNEYRINTHVYSRILGLDGRGTRFGTRKLLKWIDRINPDIIHLHNIHSLCLNYPMLFNYINKKHIPVVWTLHDCWAMTGGCAHFSAVGCEKWKSQCEHCTFYGTYHRKSWINTERSTYNLKKRLFSSVDNLTIVPVSYWLEGLVKQSFLKDKPTKVIQNGIDLSIFHPIKDYSSPTVNTLLSVGKPILLGVSSGWNNEKGLQEMIRLSSNPNYQVVLVGVQEGLSLPPEITAVKRTTNQQELAEYYSAADVFVNPTYNDSFPTVNIEALACGTPVITYNTDGSPEIIDNETGRFAKKGNYEALVANVQEILDCGKERFTEKCVKRALALFNKDDRYKDYIDLYHFIVK